jgi:hypothetical protein
MSKFPARLVAYLTSCSIKKTVIDQIRHLQSLQPFQPFALELANGRVIQIHDRHQVATTEGDLHYGRREEAGN